MNTFLKPCSHSAQDTLTRTMPSWLPVMMTWLVSHAGPSITQQQVMAPSGPQAVVMLARDCPLTFHKDRWAPAQETMVPCNVENWFPSKLRLLPTHWLLAQPCSLYTQICSTYYLLKTNRDTPRPSKIFTSVQLRPTVLSHNCKFLAFFILQSYSWILLFPTQVDCLTL